MDKPNPAVPNVDPQDSPLALSAYAPAKVAPIPDIADIAVPYPGANAEPALTASKPKAVKSAIHKRLNYSISSCIIIKSFKSIYFL